MNKSKSDKLKKEAQTAFINFHKKHKQIDRWEYNKLIKELARVDSNYSHCACI